MNSMLNVFKNQFHQKKIELWMNLLEKLQNNLVQTSKFAAQSKSSLEKTSKSLSYTIETIDLTQNELMNFNSNAHTIINKLNLNLKSVEAVSEKAQVGNNIINENNEVTRDLLDKMTLTYDRVTKLLFTAKSAIDVCQKISTIIIETKLLSFNASLEASRAGENGKGFAIVANEIHKLAQKTTLEINEMLSLMGQLSNQLEPSLEALETSRGLTDTSVNNNKKMVTFFQQISELSQTSTTQSVEIVQLIETEMQKINHITQQLNDSQSNRENTLIDINSLNNKMTELMVTLSDSYNGLDQIETHSIFHTALKEARQLALAIEQIFKNKIAERTLTYERIIDLTYFEIKGSDISKLNHLFDTQLVPRTGFTPSKYNTHYDLSVDSEFTELFDKVLKIESEFAFALLFDLNGYAPSHNSKFMKKWNNNSAHDLANNRCKRFFDDSEVILKASRFGIHSNVEQLQKRMNRQQFLNASTNLENRSIIQDQYLVQTYARDTGEVMNLLAVPVFLDQMRIGSIGIGWTI